MKAADFSGNTTTGELPGLVGVNQTVERPGQDLGSEKMENTGKLSKDAGDKGERQG